MIEKIGYTCRINVISLAAWRRVFASLHGGKTTES
jgi:hypothetical protein